MILCIILWHVFSLLLFDETFKQSLGIACGSRLFKVIFVVFVQQPISSNHPLCLCEHFEPYLTQILEVPLQFDL